MDRHVKSGFEATAQTGKQCFGARSALVLSGCGLALVWAAGAQPAFAEAGKKSGTEVQKASSPIDLLALEKQGFFKDLKKTTVRLKDDPAYNKDIEMEGYALSAFIEKVPALKGAGPEQIVVFKASDGYFATAPLGVLKSAKGVLATGVKGRPQNDPWPSFKLGDNTITPGPFYLVWDSVSYENKTYPWPWGVVTIELTSADQMYAAAVPTSGGADVKKGFDVFSTHCITCHSINGAGGKLGPEFNYPKSITEYWSESHFVAFAREPKSYRYDSKMYPKTYLSGADFKGIWAYLQHMKSQKKEPESSGGE